MKHGNRHWQIMHIYDDEYICQNANDTPFEDCSEYVDVSKICNMSVNTYSCTT